MGRTIWHLLAECYIDDEKFELEIVNICRIFLFNNKEDMPVAMSNLGAKNSRRNKSRPKEKKQVKSPGTFNVTELWSYVFYHLIYGRRPHTGHVIAFGTALDTLEERYERI
jgi:hypothetical protein